MRFYLSSPCTQQQAQVLEGMPVLLSYATWSPFLYGYQQTFSRILIDSGAFSEMNSGKKISLEAYKDWAEQWRGHADAIAGLDNIMGDWRQSLANYAAIPWTFPTIHDTDPLELLDELIPMALERKTWLGIGLQPPRAKKEEFILRVLEKCPEQLHVHGWALGLYAHIRRFNSLDSTNWFRDAMKYRQKLPWLTYGETLDLIVKRYQRRTRTVNKTYVYDLPTGS